jgi:hypothetical protein
MIVDTLMATAPTAIGKSIPQGLRRAREHVLPHEDASLQKRIGVPTRLAKLLVIFEEPRPGRMTVVIVREPVGV